MTVRRFYCCLVVHIECEGELVIIHGVVGLRINVWSEPTECMLHLLLGDEVVHMVLRKGFVHFALVGWARVHVEDSAGKIGV
jgi:hypothetical protein